MCLSDLLVDVAFFSFPSFSLGCPLHWRDGVGLLAAANERSEVRHGDWYDGFNVFR